MAGTFMINKFMIKSKSMMKLEKRDDYEKGDAGKGDD